MKIKDLRHFREFFKEKIRESSDSNRDVHFVGTHYYDKTKDHTTFGFFDVYHGQKSKGHTDGIKGFLKGFLDMAQDAQAVYEFLQNAVDADSSHFLMVWTQDTEEIDDNGKPSEYLMVLNNGKQFDFSAMESILNVGVSQKLEEEHTIGKFGIGFKLAHRLVGKENGLEELVENNYGPILFSWKNNDLEKLLYNENPVVEPVKQNFVLVRENDAKKITTLSEEPWLLKILISNFPTQPNEIIRDAYYRERDDIFTNKDVRKLQQWLANYKEVIPFKDYQSGSMFFLKLGTDKAKTLGGDYILDGIKFSMSILSKVSNLEVQGLKKVHINGTDIENVPLEFESINISKNSEEYNYIRFGKKNDLTTTEQRIADQDTDIQFLFGYTDYKKALDIFENVPNFYLYFPLTEEKHGLKFILHTNAFYKKSARTSLHSDDINIRLLKVFSEKLLENLRKDSKKFIKIYPLLLSTKKTIDNDKLWINQPLILPILKYVSANIPVMSDNEQGYEVVTEKEIVRLKKTKVDVYLSSSEAPYRWFYFNDYTDLENSIQENINIKHFNLYHLLIQKDIDSKINGWLDNSEERIKIFIHELLLLVSISQNERNTIKETLFKIKFLRFSNKEVLSINEFQEKENQGYFYQFKEFNGAESILIKLGFHITVDNIEYVVDALRNNFSNKSQLKDYVAIADIFSGKVLDEQLDQLSNSDKNTLLLAFEGFHRKSEKDVLSYVKLYKNYLGKYENIKNLIYYDKGFLRHFSIDANQLTGLGEPPAVLRYVKFDETSTYENIFYPLWQDVLNYICQNSTQNIRSLIGEIEFSYKNSKWTEKENNYISGLSLIIYENNIIKSDKVCFHNDRSVSAEKHLNFQQVGYKFFQTYLPDLRFLEFTSENEPFVYKNKIGNLRLQLTSMSIEEVLDILEFCKVTGIQFFQENTIFKNGNKFDISSNLSQSQYYTPNQAVKNIIDVNLHTKYEALPEEFKDYAGMVFYKEKILFNSIITFFTEGNTDKNTSAILKLVLSQDEISQQNYFEKLDKIFLDISDPLKSNIDWLRLIYHMNGLVEFDVLQNKIILVNGDIQIKVSEQPFFLENVKINNVDIPYRFLTPTADHQNQIIIKDFIDKFIDENLFIKSFFNRVFKIQTTVNTSDLKEDFLHNMSDNTVLVNIYQLFFIISSDLFSNEEIKKFTVLNSLSEEIKIQHNLYLDSDTNRNIIKSTLILSDIYNDAPNLYEKLVIEFKKNDYNFNQDFKLNNTSAYDDLKADAESLEKIKYLYQAYQNTPLNERFIDDVKIKNYLNFKEEDFFLFENSDNLTDLSNRIIKWLGQDNNKKVFLKKLNFIFEDDNLSMLLKVCFGQLDNFSNTEITENDFISLVHYLFHNKIEILTTNGNAVSLLENLLQRFNLGERLRFLPCYKSHEAIIFKEVDRSFRLHDEVLKLVGKNEIFIKDWNQLFENKNIIYGDLYLFPNRPFLEYQVRLDYSNASELKTYYYNEWKKEVHNLKLFEADQLIYEVRIAVDEIVCQLGHLVKQQNYYIIPAGNTLNLYFTKDPTIHFLAKECLTDQRFENFNLSLSLNKLEERYNTFNTQITEALKNTAMEELRDMFEAQIKKQEKDNVRVDIAARISELDESDLKYSKQWFIEYLDYLKTFEENSDANESKTIRFRKIERMDERGFYRLSAASAYIPENIDEAKHDTINIIFNTNKREKIELQFISKKNQDLIIKTPRLFTDDELKNIFLLELLYIPNVDLLERLKNAFKELAPWDNYKSTFPGIQYIYGPPGTGKTTEIQKLISTEINNNSNVKILVLTPTNKACDVIAKRIFDNNITAFYRISGPTSDEFPEHYYKNDLAYAELLESNVFISTIHRYPYYNWGYNHDDKLKNLTDFWDYLIIDEASMITLPYITFACMCAMQKNKNTKIIIAGDPKQIPPIPELSDADLELINVKTENIYSMFELDSFDSDEQNLTKRDIDTILNLPIQYRSVPEIGDVFSEFSYNSKVISNRKSSDLRSFNQKIGNLFTRAVNFVSVPLKSEDPLYAHNKLIFSSYHIYTTILVAEILKFIEQHIGDELWTIGIISPYKAQAILISKLIGDFGFKGKIKITADTVHGFQGDQCDIIFYLVTPNGHRYSGDPRSLLSKDYIYNVAISRAQNYLVVIHPFEDIRNNTHINSIFNIANRKNEQKYTVIQASEVENILFGDNKFIDKKTLVGGHENVNIYTDFSWRYYVKRSSTAIDIQVNSHNMP